MALNQSIEHFKGQVRFPKFAAAKRYEISLTPDLAACEFAGTVRISVDVVATTRFLILNAADLEIDEASVSFRSEGSEKELRPKEIVAVEEDEVLVLVFDEALPVGSGVLGIRFPGTLNDQMKGFYRS